ncbi:MAG: efflux transporter outer membrane subunit [Steroidobacteraceae bacterium]|jgi:NodT family efflux transporter outer membrane factor (OMF) lipoprotein
MKHEKFMLRTKIWPAAAAIMSVLTACNLAPHYDAPKTDVQPAFKEAIPPGEANQGWKLADPKDTVIPADWWQVFGDAKLDELESKVAISNQTVAAAAANYRASRALVAQAQAAFFPILSLDPTINRSRSSLSIASEGSSASTTTTAAAAAAAAKAATAPRTVYTVPVDATYQVDLWGSVRNTVAQSRYTSQASAAQVVTALLSTQSTLAQDYFQLRALDEQRRILDASLVDYEANIHLIETLTRSGIDSNEDLSGAENQLYTAQAEATDLGVARAQYEHAIAVLIGVPPATFSLEPEPFNPSLPVVPVSVPSELLERRADIAAAERQVAASNAQIGIARAAFFPSLTLAASGGYEATTLRSLFDWPNRFWSFGPALAQTLFDGGARRAVVLQAHALNDAAVANYRQAVLSAFESVEDNLASLRILSKELTERHNATVAAQHTVEYSVVRYRNGVDSYVNVITAQNTFLSSRESELQVRLEQQIASVNLINNLGGGWNTADWARTERLTQQAAAARERAQARAGSAAAGNTAPAAPNPPAIPSPELRPEDLLKQNADAVAPPPPAADQK